MKGQFLLAYNWGGGINGLTEKQLQTFKNVNIQNNSLLHLL